MPLLAASFGYESLAAAYCVTMADETPAPLVSASLTAVIMLWFAVWFAQRARPRGSFAAASAGQPSYAKMRALSTLCQCASSAGLWYALPKRVSEHRLMRTTGTLLGCFAAGGILLLRFRWSVAYS